MDTADGSLRGVADGSLRGVAKDGDSLGSVVDCGGDKASSWSELCMM